MVRFVVALFSLVVALPAQQVEHVGAAENPSRALFKLVKQGDEELLWFDVGYAIRSVVVRMHEDWGWIEGKRATGLSKLLDAMREGLAVDPSDAEAKRMIAVADVADALLGYPERDGQEQHDELLEVRAVGDGRMRFLAKPTATDWGVTRPRGGYAKRRPNDMQREELDGLFRATEYLHRYLNAWPTQTRQRWCDVAAQCRKAGKAEELGFTDAALKILFGAGVVCPGVPEPNVPFDLVWLRERASEPGRPHAVLPSMFAASPAAKPQSMADGVLRLCRALAVSKCDNEILGELRPAQWRAKWNDAAQFAYVGLREVDCAMRAVGIEPKPPVPRVVVEPLPEVWQALRWLDIRSQELLRVTHPNWKHDPITGSWIDPVIEALELQQRGEDLPEKLNDRLVDMLLYSFSEPDLLQGTVSKLEGIARPVRRPGPQFVRLPIRWRGETKRVLALRLFVEEQVDGDEWVGPPWGVTLATPSKK